MEVQPARGQQLSGGRASAHFYAGMFAATLLQDLCVCLCLSGRPQTFTFSVPAYFNTAAFRDEEKRKKKVMSMACLRPGEGQSGRSVYSCWPQLAGRVWTVAAPHGRLQRCCLHLAFCKAWASLPGCSFYHSAVL